MAMVLMLAGFLAAGLYVAVAMERRLDRPPAPARPAAPALSEALAPQAPPEPRVAPAPPDLLGGGCRPAGRGYPVRCARGRDRRHAAAPAATPAAAAERKD